MKESPVAGTRILVEPNQWIPADSWQMTLTFRISGQRDSCPARSRTQDVADEHSLPVEDDASPVDRRSTSLRHRI